MAYPLTLSIISLSNKMSAIKKIAILGSTGSVGMQALEVVRSSRSRFHVSLLSANNNAELLLLQAIEFKPQAIVIGNEAKANFLEQKLANTPVKVFGGLQYLSKVTSIADFNLLVNALSGINGLQTSLKAIEDGKNIAMANKEAMVAGGALIMESAREQKIDIIPVDSEHSAVFQCLLGESFRTIRKIFLTASGGPFRGMKRDELNNVTVEQALKHPNWKMGNKISIDSATLANKGLEAIAAQWFFNLYPDQIGIIRHPQSIVHSLVQFTDGNLKAQLAIPDMRIPIHYALHYPERQPYGTAVPDFSQGVSLSFEEIELHDHPDLMLALKAMYDGGNIPAAFSAANELAVHAFLNERISFTQIAEVSKYVLKSIAPIANPSLSEILDTDEASRTIAKDYIKTIQTLNR